LTDISLYIYIPFHLSSTTTTPNSPRRPKLDPKAVRVESVAEMWRWDNFLSKHFDFRLSLLFYQGFLYTFTYNWHYIVYVLTV